MSPFRSHLIWIAWRTLRGPVWLYWAYVAFWFEFGGAPLTIGLQVAELGGLLVVVDAARCARQSPRTRGRSRRVFPTIPLTAGARAVAEFIPPLLLWFAPLVLGAAWVGIREGVLPPMATAAYVGVTTAAVLWVQSYWDRPMWGIGLAIEAWLLPRSLAGAALVVVMLGVLGMVDRVRDKRHQIRYRESLNRRVGWVGVAVSSMGRVLAIIAAFGLAWSMLTVVLYTLADSEQVREDVVMVMKNGGVVFLFVGAVWFPHRPRRATQPGRGHSAAGAAASWARLPVGRSESLVDTAAGAATGFGVFLGVVFCILATAEVQAEWQAKWHADVGRGLLLCWPVVCVSAAHYLWSPRRMPGWVLALAWTLALSAGQVSMVRFFHGNVFPWWLVSTVWVVCAVWFGAAVRAADRPRNPLPRAHTSTRASG